MGGQEGRRNSDAPGPRSGSPVPRGHSSYYQINHSANPRFAGRGSPVPRRRSSVSSWNSSCNGAARYGRARKSLGLRCLGRLFHRPRIVQARGNRPQASRVGDQLADGDPPLPTGRVWCGRREIGRRLDPRPADTPPAAGRASGSRPRVTPPRRPVRAAPGGPPSRTGYRTSSSIAPYVAPTGPPGSQPAEKPEDPHPSPPSPAGYRIMPIGAPVRARIRAVLGGVSGQGIRGDGCLEKPVR